MSSELKTKGELWRERIFKMILFFAIMGIIALCVGVHLLTKTLNEVLAPEPAPGSATKVAPAK